MSIVERMARAICGPDPDMEIDSAGNVQWMLHEEQARAALRAVRAEDVSDEMVLAAGKEYWGALWDTDEGSDKEWLLSDPGLSLRRAIAAAIAAGAGE